MTNKIYILAIIRLLFTISVLYFPYIPLYLKMIIIFFGDFIDCTPLYLITGDITFCKNSLEYQLCDKINDSIYYILLFCYLYLGNILNNRETVILFLLLVYRLIGLVIFIIRKNLRIFIVFPNFFEIFAFVFVIFKHFNIKIGNFYIVILSLLIIIMKFLHEYFIHYYSFRFQNLRKKFYKMTGGVVASSFSR